MTEDKNVQEHIQPYRVQSWTRSIIRPTLIILMVAAFIGALLSVIYIFDPSIKWRYAYIICFFIILESYFTTSWLHHPARRSLDHLKYRLSELLVLFVLIRIFTWAIQGNWPESGSFLIYLKSPFTLFSDGFFWGVFILGIIAWQRTIAISRSFLLMEPDEAELGYYSLPRNQRDQGNQPISNDRSYLLHGYAQQFLGGGLVVLLCAALASYNFSELTTVDNPFVSGLTRLGLSSGMLASLLIYFLSGFLLLSQGRLAILEIRWLASDIKQQTPIGRHWHRRTLFLLLGLGLIAAFLPVGSTLPFMQIMNLIFYGIITLIMFFVYLGSLLIFFILSIFFPKGTTGEDTPLPPPPAPEMTPINPIETSETFQYIFSSAFWAVAIILIIIAFAFFISNRGIRINSSFFKRLWLTAKIWWHQLRQGIGEQMQDIEGGLQAIFQQKPKEQSKQQSPWRFIRINALPPREKILYFYLSTVKRAEKNGVVRQENETPLEFANDLKASWPQAEGEIEDLTDAFLHAQYSPNKINESEVTPVKKQWQRLKSNLKKRKKTEIS